MTHLSYLNPSTILIDDPTIAREVEAHYTYQDRQAEYAFKRFKHNQWFERKYGREAFQLELDRLKRLIKVSAVTRSDDGSAHLPAGILNDFCATFGYARSEIANSPVYPEPATLPYKNVPKHALRYYQEEAVTKLLAVKHGAVEISTGGGKSAVIEQLVKRLGLKTVIVVPSRQLAEQMTVQLAHTFGANKVGQLGDGKKKTDKLITVAISHSVCKMEPKKPGWDDFASAKVLICDESHTLPAKTLSKVAYGPLANAPYRFFLSATQLRNDGKDLVLEGIIGPVVYSKSLPELVAEGYLAKPIHYMVTTPSERQYWSQDFLLMAAPHYYQNAKLHKMGAELANRFAKTGRQVLILIDRVDQFQYIYPHLDFEFGFAHGGGSEDGLESVPKEYKKSDPDALVKRFNDGELKMLIGTSCISTGTDTRPVGAIIFLQTGSSEIKFRQSLGRGTRKVPGKEDFFFVDFEIELPGVDPSRNPFARHARTRRTFCDFPVKEIYQSGFKTLTSG